MDYSRQNSGAGCHFLLQGIFPAQDRNCVSMSAALPGGLFNTVPPEAPVGRLISAKGPQLLECM